MKRIALLFSCLLLLVGSALAETPSETAKEYIAAIAKKDYAAAASFFHPDALGEFRGMMSFLNDIPPEAQAEIFPALFGQGTTSSSVGKLSNEGYFAAFLVTTMSRAEAVGEFSVGASDVLGEIREGNELTHVLTRNRVSIGDIQSETLEVMTFKQDNGKWKAMLSGKIKGLGSQMKKAMGIR